MGTRPKPSLPAESRKNRLGPFYFRRKTMKNMSVNPGKNQRVVTFLNRNEVDFLDKVGKDALFSTGLKVSRAKIIAWLVDFMQKINITGDGLKSEDDFENRIFEILGKNLKTLNPHLPR